MKRRVNSVSVRGAMEKQGWTQAQLAKTLGVSAQAVTNWLNGKDFPRPNALLKLATSLRLGFDDLVASEDLDRPVIAFRKKAGAKTTNKHIERAEATGRLLRPLVPYLPEMQALRVLITSPSTEYSKLQAAASETRARLGVGERAKLGYDRLISGFRDCGAVLVPVLWGEKANHENALHIYLPREDVTFIFLNLDTYLEDFKFWMAHELAHMYTPKLSGSDEGEDFADAFAGALLFPESVAKTAYQEASHGGSDGEIKVLLKHALEHEISLNTVFQEVRKYSEATGLPGLKTSEQVMHKVRARTRGALVSETLFDPVPPEPDRYIAACKSAFQSGFFRAIQRMMHELGTGSGYIQQVLNVSVQDGLSLHKALDR